MFSQVANERKILVVEDHEDSRLMMQTLLELDGFRVFTASNGPQAIKLAGERHPDAILMDINLPDCDGLAATRQIRRDPANADIPIIALTAYDVSDSRELALSAGCTDFMLKPVDFERLQRLLERALTISGKGHGSAGSPAHAEHNRQKPGAGEDRRGHLTDRHHTPNHLFDSARSGYLAR
ncbi:MAG: response regulator [Pyrinomonadaceae bacterium]